MNKIENEIIELSKIHPPTTIVGDYNNGWNDAISAIMKILKQNDNLILEEAKESMFERDKQKALKNRKTFVRNLGKVAMQTNDDCTGMSLDDREIVTISFKGGGYHHANIRMDSFSSIMIDCGYALQ
jgi:hypothetical protein